MNKKILVNLFNQTQLYKILKIFNSVSNLIVITNRVKIRHLFLSLLKESTIYSFTNPQHVKMFKSKRTRVIFVNTTNFVEAMQKENEKNRLINKSLVLFDLGYDGIYGLNQVPSWVCDTFFENFKLHVSECIFSFNLGNKIIFGNSIYFEDLNFDYAFNLIRKLNYQGIVLLNKIFIFK